jgi:hypothetical protein
MRGTQGSGDEGSLPARQETASGTYDNVIHGAHGKETQKGGARGALGWGLKSRPGT